MNGQVRIPGNLEVWKTFFAQHPGSKIDPRLAKAAPGWSVPDDLIEALFALTRKAVDNEPLRIFLALSDFDRGRSQRLEPATVERLMREYKVFGAQLTVLNEAPELRDAAILQYVDAARAIDSIKDGAAHADAAGIFQALASLWQILYRNHELPPGKAETALNAVTEPFQKTHDSSREIFDAGRAGFTGLLAACGIDPKANPQEETLDLLAGSLSPSDPDTQAQLVGELNRVVEAQRLVSLKALFDFADQLAKAGPGREQDPICAVSNRLAAPLSGLNLAQGRVCRRRNASASCRLLRWNATWTWSES